jgi:hypothetical protein
MKIKRLLFLFSIIGLLGLSWPFSWLFPNPNPEKPGTSAWLNKQIAIIKSESSNIDTKVLRLSLLAYMKARKSGLDRKELLTIIDFSLPSTAKRLWVFDLKHGHMLYNTWVSHGKNSGGVQATSFSNKNGSLKSSLGVFVTDSTPYMGGNGYSLRLRGLEEGINDHAYDRDIVFHGARYVNADTIQQYGQVGRSWGCPAVSDRLAKPLINTIKEQTLVFAYYPDNNWLRHSKFLAG